jgi:hypothetical protein
MLKQETSYHTSESDTYPFVIHGGDERELLLLLATQDARAVQARALEEAALDAEDISTLAEEALVLG